MSLSLTPAQLDTIRAYANASSPNYPAMYKFIADEMNAGRIQGATDDQVYWFEQAARINAGDASSPASVFIREATTQGLIANGQPATKDVIDSISNTIGRNVADDILDSGEIPPFSDQLNADISAAIRQGNMTIGGWGGAFYYWNETWTNPSTGTTTTVGQAILADPVERDKFVRGNAAAIAAVWDSFTLGDLLDANNRSAVGDALVKGIKNLRNDLPAASIAGEVIDRAAASISNNGGLFMQQLIESLYRAGGVTPPSRLLIIGPPSGTEADSIATALAGDLTQTLVAGEGQLPDTALFAQVQEAVASELAGRDLTGAVLHRGVGGLYVVMLASGESVRVNASGQLASTRIETLDDGSTLTTNTAFDRTSTVTSVGVDGNTSSLRFDSAGVLTGRTELTVLPTGSLTEVFSADGSLVEARQVQRYDDGSSIVAVTYPDGSEVRKTYTVGADGQLVLQSTTGTAAPLQTFGVAIQDLNSLVAAIKSGEPLPVLNSGLRLVNNLSNPVVNGTQVINDPALFQTTAVVGAIGSLYGLHNAFGGGGSDLDKLSATGNAIVAINAAAQATNLLASTSTLNGVATSVGTALPVLNGIIALKNGDYEALAVQVAAYFVPVIGWAYAAYSLITGFDDEPPKAWGTARFRFADGTSLVMDAAGESFGVDRVRQLMEGNGKQPGEEGYFGGLLGYLEETLAATEQAVPGTALGIIPQRLPSLTWRESGLGEPGYAIVDIDPLTGEERYPNLRYNDDWTPYNADLDDPAQRRNLFERMVGSALEREAIAPLWEVLTAKRQQQSGDPNAGLTEEERAARRGQGANSADAGQFRPVVLDLDGDGRITTVSDAASDVSFDWDDSGFVKQTGWVGAGEGLLVLDRNLNGAADSGRELFSNGRVADAARGVRSMAWVDANGDGKIDAVDPVFDALRVWQDADQDGVQDAGETRSLAELGITSLDYGMGRFTRNGQTYALQSPEIEASDEGVRVNLVQGGIQVQYSDGRSTVFVDQVVDLGGGSGQGSGFEARDDGIAFWEDGVPPGDMALPRNRPITIPLAHLLANDHAGGSNAGLTISAVGNAEHGAVELDAAQGFVSFLPEPDYAGEARFSYTVTAADGRTRSATVLIVLRAVNDGPDVTIELPTRDIYGYDVRETSRTVGNGPERQIITTIHPGEGEPRYEPFDTIGGRQVTTVRRGNDTEQVVSGEVVDLGISKSYFDQYFAEYAAQFSDSEGGSGVTYVDVELDGGTYRIPANPALFHHGSPIATEPDNDGRVVASDPDGGSGSFAYFIESDPADGEVSIDEHTGQFTYTGSRVLGTRTGIGAILAKNVTTDWHQRNDETYTDYFHVRVVDLSDPTGNTFTIKEVGVTHYGPPPKLEVAGGGSKPVAIDLNGDGFHFIDVDDSNVFFNVNGDGWRRRIAWNNPDDGFIAFDKNGDGKITDYDELSFVPYDPQARTDLEGLRAFDSNGDGVFTAADSKWSSFGVWQDADSDGVTDDGEFRSLADLGIEQIGLTSDGQFQVIDGQTVHGIGSATKADGSTLALADVTLEYKNLTPVTDPDGAAGVAELSTQAQGQTFTGTADADLVFGTAGSDEHLMGDGNDVVNDDAGNDRVDAGAGDDLVFTGADIDFVDAGAGNDSVFTGAGNDLAIGGAGDDFLSMESGNDVAFGAEGNDFISGGDGNDLLSGDAGNDKLFGEAGWDALLGGAGDDELWGLDGNDLLDGGDGNDLLAGGAGVDTMEGGAGHDTYEVDSIGDVVLEAADGGFDTIRSSVSYVLPAGVERLVLTGTAALQATGDGGDNALFGNAGANQLDGKGGDDTLDGGATGDSLWGGDGNDRLYGGDDSVATLALGNGIGQGEFGAYGGYSSYGGSVLTANNDFIHGGAGDDWIDGGSGNDMLMGAEGDDTILGGASLGSLLLNNDYIVGGSGDDTIDGGSGYDRYGYWRGDGHDRITDTADGGVIEFGWGITLQDLQFQAVGDDLVIDVLGRDTMPAGSITLAGWLRTSDRIRTISVFAEGFVQSRLDLEGLVANLPPFAVSDSGAMTEDQAQVSGNVLANDSDPNGAVPLEVSNVGTYAGSYGTLVLAADGSYTYSLDHSLTQVQALAPGQTLVESFAVVVADSGSPPLTATSQLSITIGGTNDAPVLMTALSDVQASVLRPLQLELPADAFGDVDQTGALTWTARLANGEPLPGWMSFDPETRTLSGVPERALAGETYDIRVGVVDNHGALADDVFAVTLDSQGLSLAGSEAEDTLTGTELDDTLDGGAGADTMIGGAGDDTYILDRWDDQVLESPGEGIDTVRLTSDFAMEIRIEELDGETYDVPVEYALPDGVENVELSPGTTAMVRGNSLANNMMGAEGDDYLDGGTGADLMAGGLGQDTYGVDSILDVVVEAADEGQDMVLSSIDYVLGDNLEGLVLIAPGLTGIGNELDNFLQATSGSNVLDGRGGNDVLSGGDGDDVLIATEGDDVLFGGAGNDTYVVDSMPDFQFVDLGNGDFEFVQTGDFIAENEGEGIDLVRSSVTYSLRPLGGVENLTLVGTAAIDGTGDEHDNVLTGNQADNTLDGDAGNDTFVYEAGGGQDTLVDASGEDTLRFGAGLSRDLIATRVVTGEQGDRVLISILDASGTDQAGQGIEIHGSDTIEHFAFADGGVVSLDDLLADTAVRSTGMAQAASARHLTGDTQMRPISPWMAMHSALSLIAHRQAGWDTAVDEAQSDHIAPFMHLLSSGGRKSAGVGSISSADRL